MAHYTQRGRALAVTTPLAEDALLLVKVSGTEAVSDLFRFQLDMLAPSPIPFAKVLNQWATVRLTLPNGSSRSINGMISRFGQGGRVMADDDKTSLLRYSAEFVPDLWRLTRRVQSRVFQRQSVPAILKKILRDEWGLRIALKIDGVADDGGASAAAPAGPTAAIEHPREYVVQYRETDFAFVSRLMEEEGIAYYFTHDQDPHTKRDRHTMVLTDRRDGFPDVPEPVQVEYRVKDIAGLTGPGVREWDKVQEIPTVSFCVADHHFQLPEHRLESRAAVADDVKVGEVTHPLHFPFKVNEEERLEVHDPFCGIAPRFDGVSSTQASQDDELPHLFDESKRVARLRAEEEAAANLIILGASDAAHFQPGYVFTLAKHFDADGRYLLTRIELSASLEGAYTSDGPIAPTYTNRFHCLPAEMPFRPRRKTPKPRLDSIQTAVVTGPRGEEIHVDKYGRVKVKFHWDRLADSSSCWVRVGQTWAGKGWGAFFWPRIGHEVVVGFEEGDPDRPLIVGSVYNATNPPPLPLPENAMLCGIRSHIYQSEGAKHHNALVFHDTPGIEYTEIHSEKMQIDHSEVNKIHFAPKVQVNLHGSFK